MDIPTCISLFSGAGGGEYASLLLGWRTVCYVEADRGAQKLLKARIADGTFPDAPIWDDARTFDGKPWGGRVDIVTAGFPCQPFSKAGRMRAEGDVRNMWPDTMRIIRQVRPTVVLLENVPNLLGKHGYFASTIAPALAKAGYDAEWTTLGARDVGAPHLRRRWWCIAWRADSGLDGLRGVSPLHRKDEGLEVESGDKPYGLGMDVPYAHGSEVRKFWERLRSEYNKPRPTEPRGDGQARQLADPVRSRLEGLGVPVGVQQEHPELGCSSGPWATEPRVGRVAHGVADRRNRLRCLGNGQVPLVAVAAFLNLVNRAIEVRSEPHA